MALRIFGEYSTKVERVTVTLENQPTKIPADLDRELIEQAKLLNITPNGLNSSGLTTSLSA